MADWADERAREIANVTDVECGEYKHLVIAITKALKEAYEEGVAWGHQKSDERDDQIVKEAFGEGLERGAVIVQGFREEGEADLRSIIGAIRKEASE